MANGDETQVDDNGGRCAVLTADDDRPAPAGVSHLLVAGDALIPGRSGAHIALCGAELRPRSLGAAGPEGDFERWFDSLRYCPACVREALRAAAGDAS